MALSGAKITDIDPYAWYNQADAARLLKCDRRTLRRWEIDGKLVRIKNKVSGKLGYRGTVLRKLL